MTEKQPGAQGVVRTGSDMKLEGSGGLGMARTGSDIDRRAEGRAGQSRMCTWSVKGASQVPWKARRLEQDRDHHFGKKEVLRLAGKAWLVVQT